MYYIIIRLESTRWRVSVMCICLIIDDCRSDALLLERMIKTNGCITMICEEDVLSILLDHFLIGIIFTNKRLRKSEFLANIDLLESRFHQRPLIHVLNKPYIHTEIKDLLLTQNLENVQ